MNKLYENKCFICSIIFLSISGPSAKSRWGNIRDNFSKSVKKNKTEWSKGENNKAVQICTAVEFYNEIL